MLKFRVTAATISLISACLLGIPAAAQTQAVGQDNSPTTSRMADFYSVSASWGDADEYNRVSLTRDTKTGSTFLYLKLSRPVGNSYAYVEASSNRAGTSFTIARDFSSATLAGKVTVFHCSGRKMPCPVGRRYALSAGLLSSAQLVHGTQRDAGNVNRFSGKLVTRGVVHVDKEINSTTYGTLTHNHALAAVTPANALKGPFGQTGAGRVRVVINGPTMSQETPAPSRPDTMLACGPRHIIAFSTAG